MVVTCEAASVHVQSNALKGENSRADEEGEVVAVEHHDVCHTLVANDIDFTRRDVAN